MKFTKYHALGNDYIVVDPKDLTQEIMPEDVRVLCDRHYGFGADGVLYGPLQNDQCDFSLKIYNPDGSEAEKSGNGLRIFSRYLWDCGLVGDKKFSIKTKGGIVFSTVSHSGSDVSVEMGKVIFSGVTKGQIGLTHETIVANEQTFKYYAVDLGNPHCVIIVDELMPELAKCYGKFIEVNNRFPNRTNVQFVKIINKNSIEIEIWERGAGYTLASGSSSVAAAAVAYAIGLCEKNISVKMPGGTIRILMDSHFFATMTGPVSKIGYGSLTVK